jgi:hypothetical protein
MFGEFKCIRIGRHGFPDETSQAGDKRMSHGLECLFKVLALPRYECEGIIAGDKTCHRACEPPERMLWQMIFNHRIQKVFDCLKVVKKWGFYTIIAFLQGQVGTSLEIEDKIFPAIIEEIDMCLDYGIKQVVQVVNVPAFFQDTGFKLTQNAAEKVLNQNLFCPEMVIKCPLANIRPLGYLIDAG